MHVMIWMAALAAHADEGMWLPQQLPDRAEVLKEEGVELPAGMSTDWRSGPLGAVGRLGYCTAAFVSKDGLLVTNGHCVRDYLQYASGEKGDLVANGYMATYTEDELWAGPTARLYVFEKSEDVTPRVQAQVRRVRSDADRRAAIDGARATIAEECEAAEENRRCHVVHFYGGAEYRLIVERQIDDLHIVYAPPESVVFFGGDHDNWAWPRHTGDVALLRAYVDPSGATAGHSSDNVPFKPESWLQVSTEGVGEGDFVFQGGYPRSTYRNRLAAEIEHAASIRYPRELEVTQALLATLETQTGMSHAAGARLRNQIFRLANREKYLQGMLDGLARTDLVARKRQEEQAVRTWVTADRKRKKAYGAVISELQPAVEAHLATWERDYLLDRAMDYPQLLGAARTAYRLAVEREKPDSERRQGFRERDIPEIRDRLLELDYTLYVPAERDVTRLMLGWLAALPADQKGASFEGWLNAAGGVDSAVNMLFMSTPALSSAEARVALLDKSRQELESSSDPWVRFAVAIERWVDEDQPERDAYAGALSRLWPTWMAAQTELHPGEVYPDANGTLRVTTGRVAGCTPREGIVYTSRTTVHGMADKASLAGYGAPDAVLTKVSTAGRARWADSGSVPLNFLTTLDNTAGNAGSPTLNAKGELVGLVFDGTYEALGSDWAFDPDVTRSIHVDIRFLLWMLDDVEAGGWILEELGVARE